MCVSCPCPQVDTLPDGVRMAIVTVSNGSIRTMGELLIYIHDDDLAEKEEADDATAAGREAFHSANTEAVSTSAAPGGITVEVVRRWSIDDRSGPLPVRGSRSPAVGRCPPLPDAPAPPPAEDCH